MRRIVLIACLALAACTDPDSARRTLIASGITPSEVGGYDWFACSEEDTYSTRFVGKGPTGQPVSGAVCSGFWLRNSTIRYD